VVALIFGSFPLPEPLDFGKLRDRATWESSVAAS